MSVKLLNEHHLEFLSLKGGCTGASESTLVKMPHCWKSHVGAHLFPALNDSKYIGFCIYNVIIMCAFGVPLTHALPIEETTMNFVLPTAMIMFCTTMCLCILFIPKVNTME